MKKNVTLNLSAMNFIVEGKDDAELIANAKKAMIEALKVSFPHVTYSISDDDVLNEKDARPGTIVKDEDGKLGIITAYKPNNKRPIAVTYANGVRVDGYFSNFKLAEVTFEEARYKRREFEKPEWAEGNSGYLKIKDKIAEVVIGKKEGKSRLVYIINGKGMHYKLPEATIKALLKDEKSEIK